MAKQIQKIKQDNQAELRAILTQMGIPAEAHDQIITDTGQAKSMDDFFGKDGLMAKFFGKRIEELLKAELTGHLGYPKSNALARDFTGSVNYRNGSFPKTIQTSAGSVAVEIPRDRNGDFEPKLLPKGVRNTNELENRIISMYGRGLTNSDVKEHLLETYGVSLSEAEISIITDKIIPEIQDWQSRLLEPLSSFQNLNVLKVSNNA